MGQPSRLRREGRLAYEAGADPNDLCPYAFDDSRAVDWREGWAQAELEAKQALKHRSETDDADTVTVLRAITYCAGLWAPEARIIGNIRAGDIARAVNDALEALT